MENLENYTKEELTIHAAKAQFAAIIYFLPFLVVFGVPFFLLWGNTTKESFTQFREIWGGNSFLILMGFVLVGVVVHELIHGLTWALFAKEGVRSMKYGVIWKYITPYCHCKEPLKIKHYIIGGLMPGIILGIIPSIIALATGSTIWLIWGMCFILAAGGDFMIVDLLRKQPFDNWVQDHPSKIGCYIYRLKEE